MEMSSVMYKPDVEVCQTLCIVCTNQYIYESLDHGTFQHWY